MAEWYEIGDAGGVASPALLVYPDRIGENIRRMVACVGGDVERLRPHVKTHKMAEVVRMQMEVGIVKFKCATLVEAELLGECGVGDVLVAMQPVGPNVGLLADLVGRFPGTRFGAIADDVGAVEVMGREFAGRGLELVVWLDVDCGMGRSGIVPGEAAVVVYRAICETAGVVPGGVHAYDGHLHLADFAERNAACERDWAKVEGLVVELRGLGLDVPVVVGSGTPTFPTHAAREAMECSPGTVVLWDAGYGSGLEDLDYLPAAVLMTRVVSKPGEGRLCLDLGHKSVAAENPLENRVRLMGLDDAVSVAQSEEHLVVETARAGEFVVGDVLYGVPWHVCPTVALHNEAVVVRDGVVEGRWEVRRGRALRN